VTDKARSYVRTLWPVLLGHLAAWIVVKTTPFGFHVDTAQTVTIIGFVLAALVYGLGRELERTAGSGRAAAGARWVGRFLLSLGLDVGQPLYPPALRAKP
jgi:hypothetical protein